MSAERILFEQIKANFIDRVNGYQKLVDVISECSGNVICTGVGKSSYIGMKFSASLASIGIKSFFVHPIEALHGDMGRIGSNDLVIVYSNSGSTGELSGISAYCQKYQIKSAIITGNPKGQLAKYSDVVVEYFLETEICPNNLAPTSSTTIALIISELTLVALVEKLTILPETFWTYHPAGNLGALNKPASHFMRPLTELPTAPIASSSKKIRKLIAQTRFGCVLIPNGEEEIGILTDGDLRSLPINNPIKEFVNFSPLTIDKSCTMLEVKTHISKSNINLLFVLDGRKIIGFIHYSDFLEL